MTPILVSALSVIGLSLFYLFFAAYQFKTNDTWYPTVVRSSYRPPSPFWSCRVELCRRQQGTSEHQEGTRVSPPKEVVDQIAKDIVHIETGAQSSTDLPLHGCGTIYDPLRDAGPDGTGRLMNRYYETIFKPVKEQKGTSQASSATRCWRSGRRRAPRFPSRKRVFSSYQYQEELEQFNRASDGPQSERA